MKETSILIVALMGVVGCGAASMEHRDLVADCKALCQRQRDAQCPNDALDDCESRCDRHGGVPGCEAQFDALVTCATGSPISCGSTGFSMATACQNETTAAQSCVLGGAATLPEHPDRSSRQHRARVADRKPDVVDGAIRRGQDTDRVRATRPVS